MAQFLKEEVKDKIQNSAVEVFTNKGFKKSSIKEIATNAGVSVGNVYRYYSNKETLYESVIEGVYEGVETILNSIEASEKYHKIHSVESFNEDIYKPMLMFIALYRNEKKVFNMLLKGEKDAYYEQTMVRFIDMLKDYFIRFWGHEKGNGDMTYIEASAFTNAIVFSVIDLLNNAKDDEVEKTLMEFVTKMITGYFYMRKVEIK